MRVLVFNHCFQLWNIQKYNAQIVGTQGTYIYKKDFTKYITLKIKIKNYTN